MIRNNLDCLLDISWVKNFLVQNQEVIFGKNDANIEVLDVKKSKDIWPQSYALIYKILNNNEEQIIRASASTQIDRKPSFLAWQYFYNNGFDRGNILVPKPLAFFDEYNLYLYENADGNMLIDLIRQGEGQKEIIIAAQAIKKLHSVNQPKFDLKLPRWTIHTDVINNFFPGQGNLIKEKCDQLISWLDNFEDKILCHGDFQANNLIINNSKLFIIDFGSVCNAPKELDLATFALQLKSELWQNSEINTDQIIENFLNTYNEYDKKTYELCHTLLNIQAFNVVAYYTKTEEDKKKLDFSYQLLKKDLDKI